jgi:GAF domain
VRPGALRELIDGLASDRREGRHIGLRLVDSCVETLDVTGAGIMLMIDDEHRGTFACSDPTIGVVEDLQFTLGTGPCIDTYRMGEPVLEPQLADPTVMRWPGFSGPAVEAGVQAIFGFPLLVVTQRLGALDLYLDHPGELRPDQVSDALILADVAAHAILEAQASAPGGELARELEAVTASRAVVHQAAGMALVQLDVPIDEAMSRIRARAYAEGRTTEALARDIVERLIHLNEETF